MPFFKIILFFCLPFSLFGTDLSYTIRPVKVNREVQLEVKLKFQTENSNATFLYLPSTFANQNNLYSEIVKLECTTPEVSVLQTEYPHVLKILHGPDENIEIKYLIKSTHSEDAHWYYRPIIEKDHFLIFGYCLFIIPHMDYESPANICLKWKGFPQKWSLANSFGIEETNQKIRVPVSQFHQTIFAGGHFSLIQCGKKHAPIYLAVRDKWSFSLDHFTELLETIIHEQRKFWDEENFTNYLVTLMPSKSEAYNSGTAVHNAFSIFINDFPEESQGHWNNLGWLLSHEHFHTWNGLKMTSDSSLGAMEWFTEGFTEYYALKFNYRLNLLQFADYLNTVNQILLDYYGSPVLNAKNKKIPSKFWENAHYQQLPYVRGFVLALNWDQEIKRLSHDQYSLDDLMLNLYKKVKRSGKSFTIDDIQKLVGKFIGKQPAAYDIKNYIQKGKTIPLRDDLFQEKAFLEWKDEIPQFLPQN